MATRRFLAATALGGMAALGGAVAVAGPAAASAAPSQVMQPMIACSPSGQPGGQVAQATVLARAQAWVDANVPYTQSCANEPGGYYRLDCSGFVSMAWELATSLTTWDFDPATNGGDARFQQISRTSLVPGDALVVDSTTEQHIVLFTGWSASDNGQHRYANISEESTYGVGTIAKTDQDLQTTWGAFTPIHYVNMVLPKPPTPARVGVLTTGGSALVKEGGLSATWVTENSGIRQVVVSGDRIGVLTTTGTALVKEGGLSAAWDTEYSGVQQLALSGDRIGIITTTGAALVKDGDLSAPWDTEYSGVQQLALAGNRIGIITTANVAYVKEGGLSTTWVHEQDDVQQISLS